MHLQTAKRLTSTLLSATLLLSAEILSACSITPSDPSAPIEHSGEEMVLSAEGGVYDKAFTLYVTPTQKENSIYYSLDGTSPEKADTLYTNEGITISDRSKKSDYPLTNGIDNLGYKAKGTRCGRVVRLSERNQDGVEVASKTVTYVIDPEYCAMSEQAKVPVVCLTAERSVWLGDKKQIGFYEDVENDRKERMDLEYYDASLQESFALSTQVKLGGNWTKKNYPKRTFNLNWKWADEEHTVKNKKLSEFGVHLFGEDAKAQDGSALKNLTQVRLHSAGNAFALAGFNDAIAQGIASEDPNVATAECRPCLLYLNGEFWGYYTIREHYSDSYFEKNYGVDSDNVIYYDKSTSLEEPSRYGYNLKSFDKEKEVTIGDVTMKQVDYAFACLDELYSTLLGEGNLPAFGSGYVSSDLIRDMGEDTKSYEKFCSLVDIDSFIDMVLIEAYVGNWDFFYNNMRIWRVADPSQEKAKNPYADGKWRFCLHDLDFALENASGTVNIAGGNVLESYTGLNGAYNMTTGANDELVACLLEAPMLNAQFRERFLQRAAEVEKLFAFEQGSNAYRVYNQFKDAFAPYENMEFTRWNGHGHYTEFYHQRIDEMKVALLERGAIFHDQVVKFVNDYANPATRKGLTLTVREESSRVNGAKLFAVSDTLSIGQKVAPLDDMFGKDTFTPKSGVSFTFLLRNSRNDWNDVFSTRSVTVYTGVVTYHQNHWYEANDNMSGKHGNDYWKKLLFDSKDFDNANRDIIVTVNFIDGRTEFYRNGVLVYKYNKDNDNRGAHKGVTMNDAYDALLSDLKKNGFTWRANGFAWDSMENADLLYIGTGLTEKQALAVYELCK